ncbi:hypothetical protein PC116_g28916 [Phytophthora cactorum]|nr:hypothetical protein PC116_g28916 [Phytophthora cactorum]
MADKNNKDDEYFRASTDIRVVDTATKLPPAAGFGKSSREALVQGWFRAGLGLVLVSFSARLQPLAGKSDPALKGCGVI